MTPRSTSSARAWRRGRSMCSRMRRCWAGAAGNELAAPGIAYLTGARLAGAGQGLRAAAVARRARCWTRRRTFTTTPSCCSPSPGATRRSKDALSRDWMHRTLDFIETHMRHPGGAGFWHELPPTGMAAAEPAHASDRSVPCRLRGDGRGALCRAARGGWSHLFQNAPVRHGRRARWREYFTDDWSRAPGEDGRIVEPGHQMEWAWILNSARKLLGIDTAAEIRAADPLCRDARRRSGHGATYNSVRDDGTPLDRGFAHLAEHRADEGGGCAVGAGRRRSGAGDRSDAAACCCSAICRTIRAGTWIDAFDANGHAAAQTRSGVDALSHLPGVRRSAADLGLIARW